MSPHDIIGQQRRDLAAQWREKAIAELFGFLTRDGAERFVDAVIAAAIFSAPPPQGELDDHYGWLDKP